MAFNLKLSARAFALSVAMLASTSAQMIEAKPVETGQLLIKDRPKPSVEQVKSEPIKPNPPTASAARPVRPGQGTCASYVRNKKNELVCSNNPPVDQTK